MKHRRELTPGLNGVQWETGHYCCMSPENSKIEFELMIATTSEVSFSERREIFHLEELSEELLALDVAGENEKSCHRMTLLRHIRYRRQYRHQMQSTNLTKHFSNSLANKT